MRHFTTLLGIIGALVTLIGVAAMVTDNMHGLARRENQALDAEIDAIVAQAQSARRTPVAEKDVAEKETTGIAARKHPEQTAIKTQREGRKKSARAETSKRYVPPNFASLPVISGFPFFGKHK